MESKQYWTSLKEHQPNEGVSPRDEFSGELPVADAFGDGNLSADRRDFLKMLGFSITAATLAASCETPVRKAIPYVVKPEDVTPGISTYYATTFQHGSDWCPILVKTREGRPIKIEGNPHSSITQGGVSAKALASVLGLYNNKRLRQPMMRQEGGTLKPVSWDEVHTAVGGKLSANPGLRIVLLSQTILSPSTKAAVARFQERYPNTTHVAYDPVSAHGALEANAAMFGKRAMPELHLNHSDVVVSFGADYLGAWGSPISQVKGWSSRRKVSPEHPDMLRTYQFESGMSRTGANADYRVPMSEAQVLAALMNLHNQIANRMGGASVGQAPAISNPVAAERLEAAASELMSKPGKSLVLCGLNDKDAQILTNNINQMLGNYGKTLTWERSSRLKQGNDDQLAGLMRDLKAGQVDLLWTVGCNPAYDVPGFAALMPKAGMSVSQSISPDETARLANFLLPESHPLESWGDAEAFDGVYTLIQPTIRPLFESRSFAEVLLAWSGVEESWYEFLYAHWKSAVLSSEWNAESAWTHAVQHGVYERSSSTPALNLAGEDAVFHSGASVSDSAGRLRQRISALEGQTGLTLFEHADMGNGAYTDNPWLQESLDPITKVCWDNFAMVNPGWAREQGLSDGDHISISTDAGKITVPVLPQPGQAKGSIALALGYGRTASGHPSTDNGANGYALMGGDRSNWVACNWSKESGHTQFARNQTYDSLFDDSPKKRPHVKETTLEEYSVDPMAGNHDRAEILAHLKSFYPDRFANKNGFHWGMAIDLNTCIGCNACHVACQSENNIPVVGKTEMARMHDMHWIRIDRYYAGTEDDPEVVFQPMMCQHCDQAPCENVCPVAATNHSSEGINQMAYNRCIGTRYCANNCPYKVRRFNWFDYLGGDSFGSFNDRDPMVDGEEKGMLSELTRMVLNPDVTIRSRGVMEKCSFCVQRIQESKLTAKMEGRPLKDGDVRTACQAACTTGAISFGNLYDSSSEVYQLSEANDRAFRVIEEFHTLPSVTYLTKVRNKKPADHIHLVPFEGTLDEA